MHVAGSAESSSLAALLEAAHAAVGATQRRLLEVVAECERAEPWSGDGCRDLAQWLSARLGISNWTARRWIIAARALPRLPGIAAALEAGTLGIDKVAELCRFATPETEKGLVAWARRVGVRAVRRKADLANRPALEEVVDADGTRYLSYWWFDDGKRLGLEGALPADQGAVVAKALDRLAGRLPDIAHDEHEAVTHDDSLEARRADALVAMASSRIANDQDPDRATVVVHAELAALCGDEPGCELEGGPVLHPETARRLACDARLEVVVHDRSGHAVGIGRASRFPPPWLVRQLRAREGACTFPGCEARRFLHAHHIRFWGRNGVTELDNLVLCCHFHHKLVHEYGWRVALGEPGTAIWTRPDGSRFDPGARGAKVGERAPPPGRHRHVA